MSPEAYHLREARFLQAESSQSAADALNIAIGTTTPANRVRTILTAFQTCSVSETQVVWFAINNFNTFYPVTIPSSRLITPVVSLFNPCLTEGMELKLFPGERLYALRAAATAGSTMSGFIRFIESDLDLYNYDEPQMVRRMQRSARSMITQFGGGGGGIIGGPGSGPAPPSGGGGPLPV